MISRTLMRKIFSDGKVVRILAATASLWLAACMGTGTDTENGIQVNARVLGQNGAPLANVKVQVHGLEAGPESSEDPLMSGTGDLRTDSTGHVQFNVKRAGRYMFEGQRGDSVLVLDTLTAAQGDTAPVFQTAGVQRLRGKVRLYSGYKIDTGFVFLRGSSVTATVSGEGEYDFGYVPVSARGLALGAHYQAAPASNVFVKVADASAGALVFDSRFTLDSTLVPGSGANLTLLKASQSATNVCLENALQPVEPGISLKGSVGSTGDIMRAASFACSQKVGAKIQVNQANLSSGAAQKKLGDFVLPDADIIPSEYRFRHGLGSGAMGQKVVVPAACLQDGASTNYSTALTQGADGTDIRVDDIGLASGDCHL